MAAKGEDGAVGEVGAVKDAVGQHIAKGQQGVDRARMQAVEALLTKNSMSHSNL